MFDILVFTDATSDQSLSGAPGFQFVAASPGATPTDQAVVQQRLQHSVPASLAGQEWAQHPATCAYARADERMYLSRGQSTGATLGGRPGNQLTVAIMTSDPFDVLPLRPAQLFSSRQWDFTRPTHKDLAGWESPLQIDEEFDIPGLHALVVNDPWAMEILPAALTMLEQTQSERRVRLFLRHPDQTLVMRWVALLSRFLDAETALEFDFRVFSDDPLRSNTHVVGVHPDLSADLTAASAGGSGVNIIDLQLRVHSGVEPSESAMRYARWFSIADPYEALEAIDVGRRWARHMDGGTASLAAELVAMESTRGAVGAAALRAALTAITALSRANAIDELEAYGDALADVVASCPPSNATDLLAIDAALWASRAAGDAGLAQSLALAGLEWTAAKPGLLWDWAVGARPSGTLTWHDDEARTHAAGLLATSLHTVHGAALPVTFAFGAALNVSIDVGNIADPVGELVDQWLVNPSLTAYSRGWVCADQVTARLAAALDARLTAGDAAVTRSLAAGTWDWLAPLPWRLDPQNPASRWLALRELRGADAARRAEVLATAEVALPSSAWSVILPTPAGLDPDEVVGWIQAHGDLDPALAVETDRILSDVFRHPAWQRTGGARVIHQIGKIPGILPTRLRAAVDVQTEIIAGFEQASTSKDQVPNTALRNLGRRYAGRLTGLYGAWIVKAVLESNDSRSAVALAEGPGRTELIARATSTLESQLRTEMPSAMLAAVRLLDPALGPWNGVSRAALDSIWDTKASEQTRTALLATVAHRLSRDQQAWLDGFLEAQSKGKFTRGVLRGARSVFGNRDWDN